MSRATPGGGDPIRPLDWLKLLPFEPAASSDRLGWAGLEAARNRAVPGSELHAPAITHHRLILFSRPPEVLDLLYEGVKRHVPPPAGVILVVPAGIPTLWRWSGSSIVAGGAVLVRSTLGAHDTPASSPIATGTSRGLIMHAQGDDIADALGYFQAAGCSIGDTTFLDVERGGITPVVIGSNGEDQIRAVTRRADRGGRGSASRRPGRRPGGRRSARPRRHRGRRR